MFAILNAILFIFYDKSPNRNYIIFTDSVSALLTLKKIYPSRQLVQEIKDWLVLIHSRKKVIVEFCWVPSHVGIDGNERADAAAKSAAALAHTTDAKVPHLGFKDIIHSFVRRKWQLHWETLQSNFKLKSIRPLVSPWRSSCLLDRRSSVVITRLRIGHTYLTHRYLKASGAERQVPLCSTCQVDLNVKHILIDCPAYRLQRRALNLEGKSLVDLLGEDAPLEEVCKFLKRVNLFFDL